MEYEQIRSERQGEVQVLTLSRPDRLNAWTPQMAEELADAIERRTPIRVSAPSS